MDVVVDASHVPSGTIVCTSSSRGAAELGVTRCFFLAILTGAAPEPEPEPGSRKRPFILEGVLLVRLVGGAAGIGTPPSFLEGV